MKQSRASLAPFIIWTVLFTLIPLLMVLWFAFTDSNGAFTLANWGELVPHLSTIGYSAKLGGAATVICLVLAYPFAYSLSRKTAKVQQVMIMIIMLPMWMNFLLRTYAWMSIIENNGFINQILGAIGIGPVRMINTGGAVVLGMVYNYLPFMVLPLYSIMSKIDNRVIEAAHDLGGGAAQTLFRVILPLSLPGILSGITMVFVPALSTIVITKLLGGSLKQMVGDTIETMFIGQAADYNVGSALSLVLMILILISIGIMGKVDKSDDEDGGLYI